MDLQGFGHLLISGAWVTLQLALCSLAVGLIFGLLGASAKVSSSKTLRAIGNGYTLFVRGMPELLLVLTIFFGSSALLMAIASLFGYDEYIELFETNVTQAKEALLTKKEKRLLHSKK